MVDGSPLHVLDAAQHLVHDYPGGAASLAPRLGKTHTTLCNEVTGRHGYKFGLQDSVKASVFADDLRILNAFAAGRCPGARLRAGRGVRRRHAHIRFQHRRWARYGQ